MIDEDDLAAIAGLHPELQFREVVRLALRRMEKYTDPNGNPLYGDYDFMSAVLPAAEVFGIDELTGSWELPYPSWENCDEVCRNFRAEATRLSLRFMYRHAFKPERDPNTVVLDPPTKERVRFHIGQVRSIVDQQPIDAGKKDRIFTAIATLELEIDRSRTRMAAAMDLVGKHVTAPSRSWRRSRKSLRSSTAQRPGKSRRLGSQPRKNKSVSRRPNQPPKRRRQALAESQSMTRFRSG